MKLRLDVPGVPEQVVGYNQLFVNNSRWPEEGMRVAVTVDRKHPDRVDVHWESAFGEVWGGNLGRAAEALIIGLGGEADLSKGLPSEQSGEPAPDYKEQIDELNRRYAAGEITYEEMAAGVQRALGAG